MTSDSFEKDKILYELIDYLKLQKDSLCKEWVKKIVEIGLLKKMSQEDISYEIMYIYDNTIGVLKIGCNTTELQKYSRDLSEHGIQRGVETELTGILLILRDVMARELFKKYGSNFTILNNILDIYEPSINKVLNSISISSVQERERIIRHSTPLVEIWDKIVMLPLIGILDQSRAKQITEAVLERIAKAKTEVFVLDISGIATIDSQSIGYIIRSIQAARLMGSDTIITGIRPDVAATIISLGIDMSNIVTRSTLREGLEYAYSRLGLVVTKTVPNSFHI